MSRTPRHIAYYHPHAVLYGAARSMLVTLKALDRRKFVPHLVLPAEGPLVHEARSMGVDTHVLPWLSQVQRTRPLQWLRTAWLFSRWCRAQHIAILEMNLWPCNPDGLWLYLTARLSGAKFTFANRNRLTGWPPLYDKFWMSRADHIISVSRAAVEPIFQKARRSDLWSPIRRERVSVIPDGRTISDLQAQAQATPDPLRALGVPQGTRVVGIVGAICQRKRQDLFIRAAAEVVKQVPNTYFLVVGAPYRNIPSELAYAEEVIRAVESIDGTW